MPLTLKIVSFKGQPYHSHEDVLFDQRGGSIGRSDENTLVLPDPDKFVSRRHASILFDKGQYIINDSSLSGTFVNTRVDPLVNSGLPLIDGMQIKIGDYEILVSIAEERNQANVDVDHFSPFLEMDSGIVSGNQYTHSGLDSENLLDTFDHPENPANLFSTGSESSALLSPDIFSPPTDARVDHFSSLMHENIASIHDSFVPSAPVNTPYGNNEIPDDFNFEDLFNLDADAAVPTSTVDKQRKQAVDECDTDAIPESTNGDDFFAINASKPNLLDVSLPSKKLPIDSAHQSNRAPAQPTVTAADAELFNAFLQGAGLDNKNIKSENTLEQMQLLGMMFRHLVEGTAAILRNRAEFKSQFRVSVTTIKSADNNPLKFSVTTDEAVSHLINNGQGGFKRSIEAIDEGFNDIVSHQMAMQAGIQAALIELFSKFDPKVIEKLFEEGLVLQKKSKCWDKYVNLYPGIVEQTTEDFFGEAFADTYEKQMRRLTGSRSQK
ncbi:MAG: type VI secretion system-associated FHA domain protein TagH [Methylococcaceae bacterium]|nr:type VI secretion system-associated FHA domain protein TagH [Methylococcaceae bacterium]